MSKFKKCGNNPDNTLSWRSGSHKERVKTYITEVNPDAKVVELQINCDLSLSQTLLSFHQLADDGFLTKTIGDDGIAEFYLKDKNHE